MKFSRKCKPVYNEGKQVTNGMSPWMGPGGKGHEGTFGGYVFVINVTVVMVSRKYTYVQTYQIIHLNMFLYFISIIPQFVQKPEKGREGKVLGKEKGRTGKIEGRKDRREKVGKKEKDREKEEKTVKKKS